MNKVAINCGRWHNTGKCGDCVQRYRLCVALPTSKSDQERAEEEGLIDRNTRNVDMKVWLPRAGRGRVFNR